jgi:hypothetical protein
VREENKLQGSGAWFNARTGEGHRQSHEERHEVGSKGGTILRSARV